MRSLEVSRSIIINRRAAVVRRQFGDMAYHQVMGVHKGVQFEIFADDDTRCRYRQVARLGPVRLTQEFELARTPEGPLVNTITRGQFKGGTISFFVEPIDESRSTVEVRVAAQARGVEAAVLPIARFMIQRGFTRSLLEDKVDLEGSNFPD
jgi:hypothetical protein